MISADIITRLARRLYGSPLVRNDARGELVEEIVAAALEPDWQLCSTDWAACDLIHSTQKLRIQVKQSAAKQTWHKEGSAPAKPCFSIKEKAGRWDNGDTWVEERGRNAEIFVFAWHPVTDGTADHRDPNQWQFFVVPEKDLPPQSSIALSRLRRFVEPVGFEELHRKVARAANQLAAE